MATVGPVLTCNGYNPATGQCASKTVPSYVPANETDAYLAGTYAATPTSPVPNPNGPPITLSWGDAAIGAIMDGLEHPFDTLTGQRPLTLQGMQQSTQSAANAVGAATSAAKGVTSVASGVGSLLSIATDLPRLGTIIVGGLLIAAGLFALAGGNKIIQVTAPNSGG